MTSSQSPHFAWYNWRTLADRPRLSWLENNLKCLHVLNNNGPSIFLGKRTLNEFLLKEKKCGRPHFWCICDKLTKWDNPSHAEFTINGIRQKARSYNGCVFYTDIFIFHRKTIKRLFNQISFFFSYYCSIFF